MMQLDVKLVVIVEGVAKNINACTRQPDNLTWRVRGNGVREGKDEGSRSQWHQPFT